MLDLLIATLEMMGLTFVIGFFVAFIIKMIAFAADSFDFYSSHQKELLRLRRLRKLRQKVELMIRDIPMEDNGLLDDKREEFSRGVNRELTDYHGYYHGVSTGVSKTNLVDYYYPEDTHMMYLNQQEEMLYQKTRNTPANQPIKPNKKQYGKYRFRNPVPRFWNDDGKWLPARVSPCILILLGLLLIYLGWKGVLEPMVMIPMGLGMVAINCGTLFMPDGTLGNLFLDPMLSDTDDLMNTMQIDFLQPVYTLTFSNGLIACFVFMGIGTLLDVGFLLQKPFVSLFLALCAELGTFLTIPVASALGLTLQESASVAMVGGADGPMVLFTSLALAKHLFVPITVVAYLYLGLTYGGYPYLVKLLVPKRLRAIKMTSKKAPKNYDAKVKLAFSAVLCAVLCFLFPVASPLFFSLFLGVAVRESGMKHIYDFVSGPLLYGSTFMLGVLLGVLCDAHLLLDPKILKLLVLGIVALLLSGIGGIMGGYIMYFIKKGNYNPVIGIAAVSCVPTTAKVAQKLVSKDNPDSFILGDALGANISGVITSAIITGIYITIIPYL